MVKVIAGRDKGKTGRVLEVNRGTGRLLVEGVMLSKKHVRPNPARGVKGGIAERESSIHVSNVMILTVGREDEPHRDQGRDCRRQDPPCANRSQDGRGFGQEVSCRIQLELKRRVSEAAAKARCRRDVDAAPKAAAGIGIAAARRAAKGSERA